MRTKTSLHYSSTNDEYIYEMPEGLTVKVKLNQNPFHLHPDDLFQMAARINKKRSFLFVSRILGKHIPVDPYKSLLGGAALALLWQQQHHVQATYLEATQDREGVELFSVEDVCEALRSDKTEASELYRRLQTYKLHTEEPALFIAFAETATALGHAMYDCFTGDTRFLHTTREELIGREPVLRFEEEHSHATDHRCYARDASFFAGEDTVVLVDDEVTTGNTALNIIRDLQSKYPRRQYVVASLLDWRSAADRERFAQLEQELNISIKTIALIEGEIDVQGGSIEKLPHTELDRLISEDMRIIHHDVSQFFTHLDAVSSDSAGVTSECPYLEWTGRFGMYENDNSKLDNQVQQASQYLKEQRLGTRSLCMGTGEFMYVPMRFAAEMGEGIRYQSSTRSPIHVLDEEQYAVRSGFPHTSPNDPGVANFFYNVPEGQYDEIFVFLERQVQEVNLEPLYRALKQSGVSIVHLVVASVESKNTQGSGGTSHV